jgi:hypothetical protein
MYENSLNPDKPVVPQAAVDQPPIPGALRRQKPNCMADRLVHRHLP